MTQKKVSAFNDSGTKSTINLFLILQQIKRHEIFSLKLDDFVYYVVRSFLHLQDILVERLTANQFSNELTRSAQNNISISSQKVKSRKKTITKNALVKYVSAVYVNFKDYSIDYV